MPIVCDSLRVIVFTIPKCACTSVKERFFEINTGVEFVPAHEPNGIYDYFRKAAVRCLRPNKVQSYKTIHNVPGYRTISFQRHQDMVPRNKLHVYDKVTLVRDPIDILVSAWRNKFREEVFTCRNDDHGLLNEGLSLQPRLEDVIMYFDHYRNVSHVFREHTNSLSFYLGPDRNFFEHVFKVGSIGEFEGYLSRRAGYAVSLSHRNKSNSHTRETVCFRAAQKNEIRDRLFDVLGDDYQWCDGIYDFDDSFGRMWARHGN